MISVCYFQTCVFMPKLLNISVFLMFSSKKCIVLLKPRYVKALFFIHNSNSSTPSMNQMVWRIDSHSASSVDRCSYNFSCWPCDNRKPLQVKLVYKQVHSGWSQTMSALALGVSLFCLMGFTCRSHCPHSTSQKKVKKTDRSSIKLTFPYNFLLNLLTFEQCDMLMSGPMNQLGGLGTRIACRPYWSSSFHHSFYIVYVLQQEICGSLIDHNCI